MKLFKLQTPNRLYKGITEGVPFSEGIGYTECVIKRNLLVNDYGYRDITEYEKQEPDGKENRTIEQLKVSELKEMAKELGLTNYSELPKKELVTLIENNQSTT